MKRTLLSSLLASLIGFTAAAQGPSRNLIKPGDILIVKTLQKGSSKPLIRETLVVKANGKLILPPLPDDLKVAPTSNDISVEGLTAAQAARQLRMAYLTEAGVAYRVAISPVTFR